MFYFFLTSESPLSIQSGHLPGLEQGLAFLLYPEAGKRLLEISQTPGSVSRIDTPWEKLGSSQGFPYFGNGLMCKCGFQWPCIPFTFSLLAQADRSRARHTNQATASRSSPLYFSNAFWRACSLWLLAVNRGSHSVLERRSKNICCYGPWGYFIPAHPES